MEADVDKSRASPDFFTTRNSVYQIDWILRRIRRIGGANSPTLRQGEDGVWQVFAAIGPLILGEGVLIVWRYDGYRNVAESTMTSAVLSLGRM